MSAQDTDPLSARLDELADFLGRHGSAGGLVMDEVAALAMREWALAAADDARALEQALGARARAAEQSLANPAGNVIRLPVRRLASLGGIAS